VRRHALFLATCHDPIAAIGLLAIIGPFRFSIVVDCSEQIASAVPGAICPLHLFRKERAVTKPLRQAILSILLVLITTLSVWARPSQSSFDGTWSVIIITDAGSCDRSSRYGVQIVGGRIVADGASGAAMSGRVDPAGRVSVSLRSGDAFASGSGRLSGYSGSGRWQGVSGNSRCAGHWQAQRGR
jgi:hypothetical protein